MKPVSFSLIIPTCGRPSLYATLHSAWTNGLCSEDQVLVVGDGAQPEAKRIVEAFQDRIPVTYVEGPTTKCVGAAQRNVGMGLAVGSHLLFMDDDDVYVNGGISKARVTAFNFPDKIAIFRIHGMSKRTPYDRLWATPQLVLANVSTQMFVVPNVKELLGEWPSQACSDFEFISKTVEKYPKGAADIVWRDEVISEIH